jgi:hypothetical protein
MSDTKPEARVRAKSLGLALCAAALLILTAAAAPGAAQSRPGPSVAAGARTPPDVAFARRAGSRCDRYVSTAGDDANDGTSGRAAWRTIGKALRTLRAGQVGCVLPGTYEEGENKTQNDGTARAPIVLRRAPGSASLPVVRPKGPVAVFHIDHDYWVIDGFDVDVNFQRVSGFRFYDGADHGVLRNSRLHNSTAGANVYVSGRDILVENCEVFNNFRADNEDSHGVAIVPPSSRVMVARSRIWDNGGDGVQCEDYADAPANPEDITLEDNHIFSTPANYGRTENAVDIKSCKYITIRGSSPVSPSRPGAARSRFYGFPLKPTARGEGVVIHYNARHVLIENTVIQDACRGVSVGRGEDKKTLVQHLVIRGNLIENLMQGPNCDGDAILVSRAEHLDVYGNTLRNLPRAGFRIGVNNSTGTPDRDVDFWGNTVGPAARWLNVGTEDDELESFASDRNRFVGAGGDGAKFFVGGKGIDLAAWRRLLGTPAVLAADLRSSVRR